MVLATMTKLGEYPEIQLTVADVEEKLAQRIRELYFRFFREISGRSDVGEERIPRWDGGWDSRTSRTYKTVIWRTLAKFFANQGIDPCEYLKVQMQHSTVSSVLPPNQLNSRAAIERWAKYRQQIGDEPAYKMQAEWHALDMVAHPLHTRCAWSATEAAEFAVRDRKMVSPVVRYLYALHHQLPHYAAEIEEEAVVPYVFNQRLYDNYFGPMIPARLRTLADNYRRE
jgi:hypothetical protein